jgi:hypothetical protein
MLPYLMVGFAVAFGLWYLRPELRAVAYPNDSGAHASLVRFAAHSIRAGHNPFDAWYPFLGLGSPQFVQYQSLSHIVTGTLDVVLGGWTFRWANYLLIATWPISVYAGARLICLDRWEAAAAALVSPTMVNVTGYGFEWKSFVWLGSGMWSMLWALWLLPITLGLAWRAIARRERNALAAFVVGLTCALHFITGYLVMLMLAAFVLLHPPDILRRFGRAAVVAIGGCLMFAFVFIPTLGDLRYTNVDVYTANTFWTDSYGIGKVFAWLRHGEVFDSGRFPAISLLVLAGAVVCLLRARRAESARVPLALFVVSFLLYSGRRVVGPVVDHLPGGQTLFLHRYIIGVHLAGMFLAGTGLVCGFRFVARSIGSVVSPRRGAAVAGAVLAGVLVVVVLRPAFVEVRRYAGYERYWVNRQAAAQPATRDALALIDIAKARGGGRIYAGASNNWGTTAKAEQVPLYELPVQADADSLGFYLRTNSLSSDIETSFHDANPAEYDLFDVRYVLLPRTRRPSVEATLIATRGDFWLWQVATSGYLEVVDTTAPLRANNEDMSAVMSSYVGSPDVGALRHPLVAFDGRSTPEPSVRTGVPVSGAPGSVSRSKESFTDGTFSGKVHASRPAWVMLKESYSPRWTATVDGKPVPTAMLAPSFVGVPVPAGDHVVAFRYRPIRSYRVLFAVALLTLLLLCVGPVIWRRVRESVKVTRRGSDAVS